MNRRQTSRTPGPPHRLLDSSFPAFLRGPCHAQNPYKTRTNPYKKRECKFFITSATTTYNFIALKCTVFLPGSRSLLPRGEGKGEGQIGSSQLVLIRVGIQNRPKLTVSDRNWQGAYCTDGIPCASLIRTEFRQNSDRIQTKSRM